MSLLPCPQQFIQSCSPDDPETHSYRVLPGPCFHCGVPAAHEHHVVRRSYITGAKDWVWLYDELIPDNFPLCLPCHEKVERIEAWIVYEPEVGFAWNDQLPNGYNPGLTEGEQESAGTAETGEPVASETDASPSVSPGEKCDTCGRRLPHPRKKDSPKSKVIGFRIPTDDAESIEKAWEDRADRMGILQQPYWRRTYLDIAGVIIDNLSTETLQNIVKEYRGEDDLSG